MQVQRSEITPCSWWINYVWHLQSGWTREREKVFFPCLITLHWMGASDSWLLQEVFQFKLDLSFSIARNSLQSMIPRRTTDWYLLSFERHIGRESKSPQLAINNESNAFCFSIYYHLTSKRFFSALRKWNQKCSIFALFHMESTWQFCNLWNQ